MPRVESTPQLLALVRSARDIAKEVKAAAILMLADLPLDFAAINRTLSETRFVVASHKPEVHDAASEDDLPCVLLSHEPQTRQVQLSVALIEAIADDLIPAGACVVALYASFDRKEIDSVSVISLTEHLAKLTTRDLQRLETTVPLGTLRRVVDLAVEIGREGREGKPVGTMFVVGNHRKILQMSHEGVHDPFRGYQKKDRAVSNPRVCESVKELAQIDGAFIISSDGYVISGGRILDAKAEGLTLSKGLGARHWAAAAISKSSDAVAIAVSESTGTVRIFQDGAVVLRIEPMDQAMKWHDVDTEPPGD